MVLTPSEQNYNVLERPHLIQTHNLNFSQNFYQTHAIIEN